MKSGWKTPQQSDQTHETKKPILFRVIPTMAFQSTYIYILTYVYIFWQSICHSFWHSICHSIVAFYLASTLAFSLISILAFSPTSLQLGKWASRRSWGPSSQDSWNQTTTAQSSLLVGSTRLPRSSGTRKISKEYRITSNYLIRTIIYYIYIYNMYN